MRNNQKSPQELVGELVIRAREGPDSGVINEAQILALQEELLHRLAPKTVMWTVEYVELEDNRVVFYQIQDRDGVNYIPGGLEASVNGMLGPFGRTVNGCGGDGDTMYMSFKPSIPSFEEADPIEEVFSTRLTWEVEE